MPKYMVYANVKAYLGLKIEAQNWNEAVTKAEAEFNKSLFKKHVEWNDTESVSVSGLFAE